MQSFQELKRIMEHDVYNKTLIVLNLQRTLDQKMDQWKKSSRNQNFPDSVYDLNFRTTFKQL